MFEIDLTQASNELGKNILNNNKEEFYTLLKNQPELLKNHSYFVDLLTVKNLQDFIYYFKKINEYEHIDLLKEVKVINKESETSDDMHLIYLLLKYSRVKRTELLKFFISEKKDIFKDKIGSYINLKFGDKSEVMECFIKNKFGCNDKMNEREMFCFHVFWFYTNKELFNELVSHEDFDKYYVSKCQIKMLANRSYKNAPHKMQGIIACFNHLLSEDEFYKIYNEVREEMKNEKHNMLLIDNNLGDFIEIIKEKQFLKSGLHVACIHNKKQTIKRL